MKKYQPPRTLLSCDWIEDWGQFNEHYLTLGGLEGGDQTRGAGAIKVFVHVTLENVCVVMRAGHIP